MSKPKRRAGSVNYYAQRAVPKDLHGVLGKNPIWRTLGTSNIEEAKPLERAKQDELDRLFAAERKKLRDAALFDPASLGPQRGLIEGREIGQPPFDEHGRITIEPEHDELSPEEQRLQDAVENARERWERDQREERQTLREEKAAAAKAQINELGQLRPKDVFQHPYVDREGGARGLVHPVCRG